MTDQFFLDDRSNEDPTDSLIQEAAAATGLKKKLLDKFILVRPYVRDTINEYLTPEILEVDDDTLTAVFRYRFHEWMKNVDGVMHGGFISCLLDSALGIFASIYQPRSETTPTISMNISFLNPVMPEDYVCIRVHVEDVKSRIVFVSGTMFQESAPPRALATASGQYYRRPDPLR